MKPTTILRFALLTIVALSTTTARADENCLLSWIQGGNRLCVSEHGNVNFLGPVAAALPVPDAPHSIYREGYALCYADKEQPFESADFGPDSLSYGFGPPTVSNEPGGILHVTRKSAYQQLEFTQSFYPNMEKRQVRIVMTTTNITSKTLFSIELHRGVVAKKSARSSNTKRSAMSFRAGNSHGIMLTDTTWPPRAGAKTGRANASTLGCHPKALVRPTAGYVKLPLGSLSPGQSRTVQVLYRSF